MIKKLEIKSFKSIAEMELYPRRLNIFTGTNSSGKSSTLQALLLVAQNLSGKYGLNGPLVSIGEVREAINYNVRNDKFIVSISDDESQVDFAIGEHDMVIDYDSEITTLKDDLNYMNGKFHYLSCDRIGSQDIYTKNRTLIKGVGINGEFAIDYLSDHKTDPLAELLIKYHEDYTLISQVNYWLKYIVNAEINVEKIIGTDAIKAEYEITEGIFTRPRNVGSGISYLISIIILCLASAENSFILIENPEIHLHPLSQSRLCEFLYFIACSGRQVFVETHSDHIFNGVRVGIATNTMKAENVLVEFFKLGSDNCTRNYDIEIGKYGAIENPIPNLFDQFQLDLNKMLGI